MSTHNICFCGEITKISIVLFFACGKKHLIGSHEYFIYYPWAILYYLKGLHRQSLQL